MDDDVSRWVMEFLLRHSTSDQLINKALSKLPVSNHDFRCKKAVLLRSVQSEISEASVSETVLECLGTVADLDEKEGLSLGDSLKAAYCAVAVECTVKYLGLGGGGSAERFFDAVKRVWRDRVEGLVAAGSELVATEEVEQWRDEMEAAVWDVNVRKRLVKMNTRNDALRLVRVYLGEAWAVMGPTFLEFVVARLRLLKATESDGGGDGERTVATEKGKGIQKENLLTKRKHIACHRRARGPVRITNNEESGSDASCSKYGTLPTPEVNKVQEALKSSSLELHAMVKDPLPSALRLAEAVISNIARRTQNHDHSMEAQNTVPNHDPSVETRNIDEHGPNPSSNANAEPVQANDSSHRNPILNHEPSVEEQNDVEHVPNPPSNANVEPVRDNDSNCRNQSCSNQNNVPKPSLMERNGTAHTYEWDDSIDGSPGGPSNHISRFQLPSPKRKVVSPLKKYEVAKLARRRIKKRWSLEEEDALRKGVQELGRGNWKLILRSNPEAFSERTEVDLKDKWRNMTRY
ncbi:hypothetical protein LWI28_001894 [Acer negundo]|uniref:Uncharacterized protein n=1 Tax=Acer negundo TaxID=4023 RepID=A0AAD5IBL1_ACENE|nr:hypothetical protein LWI28_001894 [Acer negundo]KAK4836969.1 hypothetical protein QYF36_001730 [Acer negundo]